MAARIDFARLDVPVIAAPMAGGPSTPELVAEVGEAGGIGFLAGGDLDTRQLADRIATVRELTDRPFGVNLFVPAPPPAPGRTEELHAHVAAYRGALLPEAARLGVQLPEPDWNENDQWEEKIALLTLVDPVPVVSFTFGLPGQNVVEDLHAVGSTVVATVTAPDEAEEARDLGVDALVVQGFEAGGHRGTHRVEDTPNTLDHLALLPMIAPTGLPMIAAGGITTSGDVRRALSAGAVAVQAGTAFLLTPEAGTGAIHRMALSDPSSTSVVTRAFTGRAARGLRNRFVEEHEDQVPAAYPAVNRLTAPLRAASAAEGDLGGVSVWAGAGWRAATEEPAAQVVRRLAAGRG
ncbi:NAD(P)H-dependent flavin oxidoreductase [Austwickia chelonae]|uniref:NAD(P)H-dependent flavin oxidoreductase n=1 Tax=Austwickia chelonae TaxID=100225 RepID=UPI000E257559|nr:nitronate monooxygenase [Austwickia chelonae]